MEMIAAGTDFMVMFGQYTNDEGLGSGSGEGGGGGRRFWSVVEGVEYV